MTNPTVLFVGDSVTDCGRREDPTGLGNGYVRAVVDSGALQGFRVLNRGISGDRVRDLRARWSDDVVAEQPDVVSILVGVNDTWRRYDSDDPTSAEEFERDYRAILEALPATTRLVLVEPFLLPVTETQAAWREDLDPKIAVVRRLAAERSAVLVDADVHLTAAGDAADLADDGVHPTPRGHAELAELWLDRAKPVLAGLGE